MRDTASKPVIAIALGDHAGIGPEVALKAALDPRTRSVSDVILVGDRTVIDLHARLCGIDAAFERVDHFAGWRPSARDAIPVYDIDHLRCHPVVIGQVSAEHGRAALLSAEAAVSAALAGDIDAVVACPHNETAIKAAGIDFDGYPSFVARRTGTPVDDTFLMLCFDNKRIVHTTLHVSLRRAIDLITQKRVENAIDATHETLSILGHAKPRIAVSGLNPEAGKDGRFGEEEVKIIRPAIARARQRGIMADGPFGADSIFDREGYDATIVMLHDQGHLPAKILATNRAVAVTIGTPILFSSVAHGSGYDIAGKNMARHEGIVDAIQHLSRERR